jgi:hypothetical protein
MASIPEELMRPTTWDDVRAAALRLPEVQEAADGASWRVRNKPLAWVRPLRARDLADLDALGIPAPTGPIIGFRTADVIDKDDIVAGMPDVFFTIPHFDGYAGVLARLEVLPLDVLDHMLLAAWRVQAPKRLVRAHPEG